MRARCLAAAASAVVAGAVFSIGAAASGAPAAPPVRGPGLSRHAQVFRPVGWRRTHPPAARRAAFDPLDVNLQYNGGSVLTSPGAFAIFWGPDWANGFSAGGFTSDQARDYVTTFLAGVGGSPWIGSQTQYCQGTALYGESCAGDANAQLIANPGQQLLGAWVDDSPIPDSPTDADVQAEAQRAAAHLGYSPGAVYLVFTPSGHSTGGFGTQFCAYHDNTTFDGQPLPYVNVPYVPDAGPACGMDFVNATDDAGHGFFDGYSIVTGHEYAEAVTDPFPSLAAAWVDTSGNEAADKCIWNWGPGDVTQDVPLGDRFFAVQPLWSNAAGGCVIAG